MTNHKPFIGFGALVQPSKWVNVLHDNAIRLFILDIILDIIPLLQQQHCPGLQGRLEPRPPPVVPGGRPGRQEVRRGHHGWPPPPLHLARPGDKIKLEGDNF